jgi:MoxR-like ATPase
MSYAILVSGQVSATKTKQVIIASMYNTLHAWTRITDGGRGESNAWSVENYVDLIAHANFNEQIIGEVLSTPLSSVDVEAITNNEIPNVLIQKLTKQYRLRHTQVDNTRTMEDVINEVDKLISTDPQLLSKYRSDGRSDKHATIKTELGGKKIMTTINPIANEPIVINRVVRDETTTSTLAFVPSLTSEAVRTYIPRKFAGGLTEEQIYTYALKSQKNVSVQGHAGTGKTTSFMTFSAKHGLEFGSMSCNAGVEPSQFFGRYVPNAEGKLEWRDGLFTHFFRNGGVLVIDEANFLPQKIASVLHGALDDRRVLTLLDHDGEVIHAHENLLIAMCWNDGYKGTSRFNEAFADRFWVKLNFEYDTEIEKKFIPSATLLDLAKSMRADTIAGVYETPVSTRLLKQFVDLSQNLSYDFAVDNFVNNFRDDERNSVKLLLDSQRHNLELELTGKVSE